MKNKKKVLIWVFVIVMYFAFVPSIFAQTVNTGNNGEYFICGISTKEDIGGVEVFVDGNYAHSKDYSALVFENFNNFIVTVLFEYDALGIGGTKLTGVVVLKANEKKTTPNRYSGANNFKLIVRKLKA